MRDYSNDQLSTSPVDPLLAEYAAKLATIYTNRTAGDYTFTGVLAEFLRDYDNIRAAVGGGRNVYDDLSSSVTPEQTEKALTDLLGAETLKVGDRVEILPNPTTGGNPTVFARAGETGTIIKSERDYGDSIIQVHIDTDPLPGGWYVDATSVRKLA